MHRWDNREGPCARTTRNRDAVHYFWGEYRNIVTVVLNIDIQAVIMFREEWYRVIMANSQRQKRSRKKLGGGLLKK